MEHQLICEVLDLLISDYTDVLGMQVMHIAAVTELQERLLPSLEHLHVRRLHLHLSPV